MSNPRVMHIQKISGIYGSEHHLAMLLPALVRRGFDVHFLIMHPPDAAFPEYCEKHRAAGVDVSTVPIGSHADPGAFRAVRRAVAAGHYDIVHTHLIHGDLYGIPAARSAGVRRIISTKHGYDNYEKPSKLYRLDGLVCRNANRVITISDALQDYVHKVEGIPMGRMATVYYGIETERMLAEADAAPFDRAAHGLAPEDFLIATVGRLVPVKGHPVLLEAMQGVAHQHPGARLLVIGDGPLRTELEARVRELDIADNVRFLGFRTDVPGILRACGLACYATHGEGFGLGVVEALLQQTPVIASRVMAIPELVYHEQTGLLVPPRDPAALRDAILHLIENPDKRQDMATRGRQMVLENFTVDVMADRTERIYRAMLEK